ncbi:hypothetical protein [Halomonas urumqiensis]|nr:hypothetical protein [Halomonas urumqiensis]
MRTPMRLLLLSLVVSTLMLAGCSYSPARLQTQPLLEIDGYSSHRYYRDDDRHHRDRYRHHRKARHHDYRGGRDYDYRDGRRGHRGGRFCPPGLRMQGRC